MLNTIFIWILSIVIMKTYTTEHNIYEMNQLIENIQWREDQLREHCNLNHFKMKQKPTLYDSWKEFIYDIQYMIQNTDPYKNLIYNLDSKAYYIMDTIVATSLQELINMSYIPENESRDISLDNHTFSLVQYGIKPRTAGYGNQQFEPGSRTPTWSLAVGNLSLTITNIM
jgi:hypothetical protein